MRKDCAQLAGLQQARFWHLRPRLAAESASASVIRRPQLARSKVRAAGELVARRLCRIMARIPKSELQLPGSAESLMPVAALARATASECGGRIGSGAA